MLERKQASLYLLKAWKLSLQNLTTVLSCSRLGWDGMVAVRREGKVIILTSGDNKEFIWDLSSVMYL